MTSLVTGATGFVGAAVARRLIEAGHDVRVLTRSSSDLRNIADLPVDVAHGDLASGDGLDDAVAGCQYLFHVAADYRLWVPDPDPMYRSNVEGTKQLMQAAQRAGVDRIVYTSSVATLGIDPAGPANEDTPVTLNDMVGHYKRSKYLAERAVEELIAEGDLPAVIVNPSTPIGPRDVKPTPTGRVIRDAALGKIPAYVDTGLNVVHVDDVAQGHLQALTRGKIGERYILGGVDLSLAQILEIVARLCERRGPLMRLPRGLLWPVAAVAETWSRAFGGQPLVTKDELRMAKKHMYFSSAKALRELDYHFRAPEEAIGDALSWFKRHGYI